jgi:hypothetical protein
LDDSSAEITEPAVEIVDNEREPGVLHIHSGQTDPCTVVLAASKHQLLVVIHYTADEFDTETLDTLHEDH